jgi:hypothetical protein
LTIKITIDGLFEDQLRYYVNMLKIHAITNHAYVIELENMVENLEQPSLDEAIEFRNPKNSTHEALAHQCHSLLSLPHLPTRRTNGRKPLVNYSQSHVPLLGDVVPTTMQSAHCLVDYTNSTIHTL